MNADRANSYSQLMDLVRDVGQVKFHPDEQERVRGAADILVFAEVWDDEARDALEDVEALADHLVDSGRWELEAAERLVEVVRACGPEAVPAGLSY